ncbi:MAG: hypothetical protein AAF560_20740 [Acidobacteriota bacterium]
MSQILQSECTLVLGGDAEQFTAQAEPAGSKILTPLLNKLPSSREATKGHWSWEGGIQNASAASFELQVPEVGCVVTLSAVVGGSPYVIKVNNSTAVASEVLEANQGAISLDLTSLVKKGTNRIQVVNSSSSLLYLSRISVQLIPVLQVFQESAYQGTASNGQIWRISNPAADSVEFSAFAASDLSAPLRDGRLIIQGVKRGSVRDSYVLMGRVEQRAAVGFKTLGSFELIVQPGYQNVVGSFRLTDGNLTLQAERVPETSTVKATYEPPYDTKPVTAPKVNPAQKSKTVLVAIQRTDSLDDGPTWERNYAVKVTDHFQVYNLMLVGEPTASDFSIHVFKWTPEFKIKYGDKSWPTYRETFSIHSGKPVAAGSGAALTAFNSAIDAVIQDIASSDLTAKHFGLTYSGHGQTEGLFEGLLDREDMTDWLEHITSGLSQSTSLQKISFLDWSTNCQTGSYWNISRQAPYADYILASELNRRQPLGVPISKWGRTPFRSMHTYFDPADYPQLVDSMKAIIAGHASLWDTSEGIAFYRKSKEKQTITLYDCSKFQPVSNKVVEKEVLAALEKDYDANAAQRFGYFYWSSGRLDVLDYLERQSGNGVAKLWGDFAETTDNNHSKWFDWLDEPKPKNFVTHGLFFEVEKPFEV